MTTDERKRKAARDAQSDPTDPLLQAQAANERDRSGAERTEAVFLREHVGQWVYFETVRINYRGLLKEVEIDALGNPTSLILNPCYRIGAWQIESVTSECHMPGERAVRWAGVLEFGTQLPRWPTR